MEMPPDKGKRPRDLDGSAPACSTSRKSPKESPRLSGLQKLRDYSRTVENFESNVRRTLGAAKKTFLNAGKSMGCVSPSVDGRGGADDDGAVGNEEVASDDESLPMGTKGTTGNLFEQAVWMAGSVEMVDRQHHLLVYKKCFLGTHGVEWMIRDGLASDIESAIILGNKMMELGLFRHVTDGHTFENRELFYRFSDSILKARTMCPSLPRLTSEVSRIDTRVARLLSQLKVHRSLNVALFEQASEQQQKLETSLEAMAHRVMWLERSQALLLLFTGVLLLVIMDGMLGMLVKSFGFLLLWIGSKSFMQVYRGGSSFDGMDHKTSCRPQSLLDQLREEDLLRTRSEITEELRSHNIDAKEIVLQDSPKQVQAPTQKEYTSCPDRPCLLRLNMSLGYQKCKYPIKDEWIGINTGSPFFFETPIFKGCAVLYVAGLDSAPPGIFQGRKRKTHLVVQGQFNRSMPFGDIVTGQEFNHQLRHIPGMPVLNLMVRMAKRMSPSMLAGFDPRPHILAPVAAGAQIINCSKPGEEPALDNPIEDMRLLGTLFRKPNGDPLPGIERKRLMSDQRNYSRLLYDTENIWTFHFWQHLLDLSTFNLDMSLRQFSLSGHLNGQPLQLMAKDRKSEEYLWSFEVWHETLLTNQQSAQDPRT